jgi:hypothetical protein
MVWTKSKRARRTEQAGPLAVPGGGGEKKEKAGGPGGPGLWPTWISDHVAHVRDERGIVLLAIVHARGTLGETRWRRRSAASGGLRRFQGMSRCFFSVRSSSPDAAFLAAPYGRAATAAAPTVLDDTEGRVRARR